MPLDLIFMGTPPIAVPTLDALVAAGHRLRAVYSQPPRPAGRGHKEQRSAVHERAAALGLEVRHPLTLKQPDDQAAFADLKADAAVVVAYGLLLPRAVLEATLLGCFNLHASLLPRWRGAAPIERAIQSGDAETGIAVMRMEVGLDTGPVLLEERVAIGPKDTTATLRDSLGKLGAALVVRALDELVAGRIVERPQSTEGVTYARKIDKAEGAIDWTQPAAVIDRQVRALSPAPGVFFDCGDVRLKVHAAEPTADRGEPGTVLDANGLVACGEGALRLTVLQRPGAKAMPISEFLRGFRLEPGMRLI